MTFKGVYTAIITPFDEDGLVDWTALKNLVEYQVEKGVAGIVPCGIHYGSIRSIRICRQHS